MTYNKSERKNSLSKQNVIIFGLVLFFALHFLYFTETYMINFPYMYDTTSIRIFIEDNELLGENFTIWDYLENLTEDTNSRGIIFPKLVVLPNYILNDFNSSNIFYINFLILSLTLFSIFLIIRQQNKKIYWTLIPISAFIFSPFINYNYWNYTILIWYLPALCIATSIYFLNKERSFKNTIFVILLSIISSFSIPLGLAVWIPGIIFMIKEYKKNIFLHKIPILYFSSMAIIGILYYVENIDAQKFVGDGDFFSLTTAAVFFTFIAVPFKLKYDIFMITAGVASVIAASFLISYLGILKNKFNEIFPWMLFLSVGSSAAILMRIGRFDPYFKGNLPYYSPIAEFFQIGILIMTAVLLYEIKQKNILKNKKLLLLFVYSVIIIQIIFLVPSYYNGWWKGDYYFNQKTEYVNCYSLYQNWDHCEEVYVKASDTTETYYQKFIIYNYFLKNNYNIFSEPTFNKEIKNELNDVKKIFSIIEVKTIEGGITEINSREPTEKYIMGNEQALVIKGHITDQNAGDIQTLYMMLDSNPILKSDKFRFSDSNNEKVQTLEWGFGLLRNYLPDGCSQVSISGVKNSEFFSLNDTIEVCNISD